MSDYIPFDIQAQIFKRLPIKSLLQFRKVSKSWKRLIDSSDFIACYTGQQSLLFSYNNKDSQKQYVLIRDDHTFPQQLHQIPISINLTDYYCTLSSSHGLFCFESMDPGTGTAILWNPSIRKTVVVVVPNGGNDIYGTVQGFGVCRETSDPKIVKIRYYNYGKINTNSLDCIPWQVEVFTLSTRVWRSPYSNLPRRSIQFSCYDRDEEVGGFLYWLATDSVNMDRNLIVSFDLVSEEFTEVKLPDCLAKTYDNSLSLHKLKESLAVVFEYDGYEDTVYTVWIMEDGVSKSFKKLLTFEVGSPGASLYGFRKSGQPLVDINYTNINGILAVYDPESKQIENIGTDGIGCLFHVFPFIETLLLLDHP